MNHTGLEHQRSETQVESEQILRLGSDKDSVNKSSEQEILKIETISISSTATTTLNDTLENASPRKGNLPLIEIMLFYQHYIAPPLP